ncbi:MAG: energy transducer TonB [Candidatus Marinimicrobia bacterium]|nr:energy transducer TonB [Candidatus Neomarinimicrobiota bacterium]
MFTKKRALTAILITSMVLSACIFSGHPLAGVAIPEPENPDLVYYFIRGARTVLFKRGAKLDQAREDLERVIKQDDLMQYPAAYPFLVECYQQLELSDSSEWIYAQALGRMEQNPLLSDEYRELFKRWQASFPTLPAEFLEADYSVLDATPEPLGGMQRFYSILEYPEMAKNMNRSGITWVFFMIKADGSLAELQLLISSYPDLDEAALTAIKSTQWVPARYQEEPVAYHMIMPVYFRL